MRRSVLLPILLMIFFIADADALDDIQGVTAVWNDFVASVGRGDYRRAHSLFSPQSRAILPYGDFVVEYGPLSAAREMVLAKPDSQSTALDADWAELAYGGVNPGSGRKYRVGVAFARNGGKWGLVAARNEDRERVEAGARALLALLWQNRSLASPGDLLKAMEAAQGGNPVLRHYRMEWDGRRFQAFPRDSGLRTFFVDSDGAVRSVELAEEVSSPARVEAAAPSPPPPPPPAAPPFVEDGMPELSEPPGATFYVDLDEELSEPPLPAPSSPQRFAAPRGGTAVTLPDSIE